MLKAVITFFVGLFLSLVIVPAYTEEGGLKETNDITSVLSEVDSHTLVIFDIDYTLLRTRTHFGSPEWMMHMVLNEMNYGKSRDAGFDKWYMAWVKAQHFNEIELCDQKIPQLLNAIQKKGATFIALTHRRPLFATTTQLQLRKLNLHFEKGILFAHEKTEKGEFFIEWWESMSNPFKKQGIHKIVFIDDSKKNIASMALAAHALKLTFIGIRYTANDDYKTISNADLIEEQARILKRNYSETKTENRLRQAEKRLRPCHASQ